MQSKYKPLIYFILGGPGSGKGTQSQLLAQRHNFEHLSAGELLRNAINSNSQYADIIKNIINNGQIVPSYITIGLLSDKIFKLQSSKYLIDGFPRNYENMIKWIEKMDLITNFQSVIHIKCSQEEIFQRIKLRGANSQRSDDNIDILKKRMVTYYNDTMPIIDHYSKQGKVIEVNGSQEIENVYNELLQKLNVI